MRSISIDHYYRAEGGIEIPPKAIPEPGSDEPPQAVWRSAVFGFWSGDAAPSSAGESRQLSLQTMAEIVPWSWNTSRTSSRLDS